MTPELHAQVEAKLVSLRQFLGTCLPALRRVRLVQYRGADSLEAVDVGLDELETEVAASVREGSRVDWVCRNERLYLRVSDADGPAPSWERVFAEEDLADVKALLRDAGFGSDA